MKNERAWKSICCSRCHSFGLSHELLKSAGKVSITCHGHSCYHVEVGKRRGWNICIAITAFQSMAYVHRYVHQSHTPEINSGKFLRGHIFADGWSSNISQFNFRGCVRPSLEQTCLLWRKSYVYRNRLSALVHPTEIQQMTLWQLTGFPDDDGGESKSCFETVVWRCTHRSCEPQWNSQHIRRDILEDKHPDPKPVHPKALLDDADNNVHPAVFDITAVYIQTAALHAQGPSWLNAFSWGRLCTAFGQKSNDLCAALAAVAQRISTTHIDPSILLAYTSCHLIRSTNDLEFAL